MAATNSVQYKKSKQPPGLNSKQKQQVTTIAKSFQGTGPQGPVGSPGSPGKDGGAGIDGTDGVDGISPIGTVFTGNQKGCTEGGVEFVGANTTVACNGKKGTNGTAGKSVVIGSEPKGTNCTEGGSNFEVEGSGTKNYACNGSPWTAGGTLPSGATETGAWTFTPLGEGGVSESFLVETALSFTLPLAAEIPASNVHVKPEGFEGTAGEDCPGKASEPKAKAGHLCVYEAFLLGEAEGPEILKLTGEADAGASKSGAILRYLAGPETRLKGSWAVTAP